MHPRFGPSGQHESPFLRMLSRFEFQDGSPTMILVGHGRCPASFRVPLAAVGQSLFHLSKTVSGSVAWDHARTDAPDLFDPVGWGIEYEGYNTSNVLHTAPASLAWMPWSFISGILDDPPDPEDSKGCTGRTGLGERTIQTRVVASRTKRRPISAASRQTMYEYNHACRAVSILQTWTE